MRRRRFAAALMLLALPGCDPITTGIGVAANAGTAVVQERGFTGTAQDAAVKLKISEAFFKASEKIFLAATVRVVEGRVLLLGGLADKGLRERAEALAWAQAGVREVINELQPVEGGVGAYARDAWIAAQINAGLMVDEQVLAVNYYVDAVNGVVYITGVAQDQAELDRVIHRAGDVRYVKRIVSHVLLKNDPRRKSG
ncbi:MAG: BON domain-containing protein [Rhodospirillales bacterium]